MGRDYSISQVNGNNNQTYCIGTDNGATNGNPRLVLKSCTNNDCSTYWEIENLPDYSPSLVNAQGCGSFSNGSNNNNPTPSIPPSYIPPNPTPTPTPGGGGTTPQPTSQSLAPRINSLASSFSSGTVKAATPTGKPQIIQLALTEAREQINWLNKAYSDVQICLVQDGYSDKLGCAATSDSFKVAANNLTIMFGKFFQGLLEGLGESFTWQNIILTIGAVILTGGISEIGQIIIGIALVSVAVVNFFTSGQAEDYIRSTYYQRARVVGYAVGYTLGTVILGVAASITASLGKTAMKAGSNFASKVVPKSSLEIWIGQKFSVEIPLPLVNGNGTLSFNRFDLFNFLKNADESIVSKTLSQVDDIALNNNLVEYLDLTHPSTPVGRRGSPLNISGNKPQTINGRWYTGHSLDRMQGRGVVPSGVEGAINLGTKTTGNTPGTNSFILDKLEVILNLNGDVITVITK